MDHRQHANKQLTGHLALGALHDRSVGVLVGSAVGDAVGLYTEFLSAEHSALFYPSRHFVFQPDNDHGKEAPTPFRMDSHRMKHVPGDWTDDTDHALLLVLSALRHTSAALSDSELLERLVVDFPPRLKLWVENGLRALDTMPLGLGRHTAHVVRSPSFLADPSGTARSHWEKSGRKSASNGSLMRTHPLGLLTLFRHEETAFTLGAALSRTTHADPRCVVACAIGTALVRGVVRADITQSSDIDRLVLRALDWFGGQEWASTEYGVDTAQLQRHITTKSLAALQLDDSIRIGFVYKTLGAGIFLLRTAMKMLEDGNNGVRTQLSIFQQLITDLIMCGGDADTNACFAGALLGGYLGFKALPDLWRDHLRHGDFLIGKAEALCQVLGIVEGRYDAQKDSDTLTDGGRGVLSEEEMDRRWNQLIAAAQERLYPPREASDETKGSDSKIKEWARRWF